MYFVYLLKCNDGSIYTGITNDLVKRLHSHKTGVGGNYTRAKGAVKILYSEKASGRGAALKREAEIKSWTRQKKLALVAS
ncbi:endonuclease [Candidatus Kaiserbacteria bacterium RIFCSPHIGHO2_01_FULL_54_36]|uniref:Endonuclease n=1 Tax=Candidatus Kaiserbacteria bacterium RIFCSPHIGHO2_01_FULL_54_36 TaxID=1798482 RepID=A0A1F6CNF4_9BACT|nr:MAG: endonuclease [Candidatus Kaiserbacteria bacterium RIFCSPHIGHO2_01_FULL_54_36]OGG75988.1 MAG: endonuclease [Candidatus Kaiserbacteria bacterium RIFCSPLOWO2_01_FULL_54_22]